MENKKEIYLSWLQKQESKFDLIPDQGDLYYNHKISLGGTADAILLGCSPWGTIEELYQSFTDLNYKAKAPSTRMRIGILLESDIIDTTCAFLQAEKVETNAFLFDEDRPWSSCQIDSRVKLSDGEVVNLEIKTTSHKSKQWGKGSVVGVDGHFILEDGQIPFNYYVQVQKQMYLSKTDKTLLALRVLSNSKDYYYVIERDEEIIQSIIKAEDDFFFNHVITEVPPVLAPSRKNKMEEEQGSKSVILDETLSNDVKKDLSLLQELKEKAAALKEEMEQIKEKLLNIDGDIVFGPNGQRLFEVKRITCERFDSASFKQEHPDLYKDYLKSSSQVRLSLGEDKEK